MPELAPDCCVVCHRDRPETDPNGTWSYLAGATPLGAMVCSKDCLEVAIRRHEQTGRVDDKLHR